MSEQARRRFAVVCGTRWCCWLTGGNVVVWCKIACIRLTASGGRHPFRLVSEKRVKSTMQEEGLTEGGGGGAAGGEGKPAGEGEGGEGAGGGKKKKKGKSGPTPTEQVST